MQSSQKASSSLILSTPAASVFLGVAAFIIGFFTTSTKADVLPGLTTSDIARLRSISPNALIPSYLPDGFHLAEVGDCRPNSGDQCESSRGEVLYRLIYRGPNSSCLLLRADTWGYGGGMSDFVYKIYTPLLGDVSITFGKNGIGAERPASPDQLTEVQANLWSWPAGAEKMGYNVSLNANPGGISDVDNCNKVNTRITPAEMGRVLKSLKALSQIL